LLLFAYILLSFNAPAPQPLWSPADVNTSVSWKAVTHSYLSVKANTCLYHSLFAEFLAENCPLAHSVESVWSENSKNSARIQISIVTRQPVSVCLNKTVFLTTR